ncbi:hypothetical protein SISNIDRAFT_488000 [Sistotremastrum niveocremeum HHB9708]|uniref:Uncharacterized protein n=1 Tax=Sistotremastrum niveocremeum HHB9708 TaxID=1314777 RepID=A0A164RY30_9AGAM|nr:hypothetical protein SISNIDRAFT_488000 [Sistotremastrum niveocremeum HHB9708]
MERKMGDTPVEDRDWLESHGVLQRANRVSLGEWLNSVSDDDRGLGKNEFDVQYALKAMALRGENDDERPAEEEHRMPTKKKTLEAALLITKYVSRKGYAFARPMEAIPERFGRETSTEPR